MTTQYMVIPYTREKGSKKGTVLRRVAIDDLTPQIHAAGGNWREIEIDGDRAVVRIDATNDTLALIRMKGWPELTRKQADELIKNNPRHKLRRNKLVADETDPNSLIFKQNNGR